MASEMSDIDKWFHQMIDSGLVSTDNTWIERAVSQKNANMTVTLACSEPIAYDHLDKILMRLEKLN